MTNAAPSIAAIVPDRLEALQALVLKHGAHGKASPGEEQEMCALEAVAWLAGEKHSDKPSCACRVISGVVRQWNDQLPTDEARTRFIRPLLAKLVGSRVDSDSVLLKRMYMVQDWTIHVKAPAFLRLAKLEKEAEAIEACARIVDGATMKACEPATSAAGSAAGSAAWSAAWSAARSAAESAAESAAWSAAESALAPTVEALQISFVELIERMCEVQS